MDALTDAMPLYVLSEDLFAFDMSSCMRVGHVFVYVRGLSRQSSSQSKLILVSAIHSQQSLLTMLTHKGWSRVVGYGFVLYVKNS